jgi:tetratricopeptide (TPR) repeat protein
MAESVAERIARRLSEGLELFGEDRVEQAVACWREVLELDPDCREARDYLESAGYAPAEPGARERVAQALELAATGDPEEAFPLLQHAAEAAPEDLEAQAALELLRGLLYVRYRARTGGGAGRPRVRVGPAQLLRYNLPPDAGFVLSMVDGHTRADELVTLCGMDPFDVLRVLCRLEAAGIVEIAA